jgi:NADPH-dependent 2,4-dienoyl-CoA reductase/sulfur reductase-like enzyme/ferredoxin
MSAFPGGPETEFPNYTRLPAYLPAVAWHGLRVLSVAAVFALAWLLVARPETGLLVTWGVVVPLAPMLFLAAPGVWRNVCPFAALNQLPRLAGFTRGLTQTPRMREYAYVIGMLLLVALVATRKPLFNQSGVATAVLLLALMAFALIGGLAFKGKSGWCSSVCPMLPVQRLYGQTPFVTVANTHCQPCVGCTKNCYDFNPAVAYLADQYDNDRHYVGYRRFFAAIFPGFILAYFNVPNPPAVGLAEMYLQFVLYSGASLALFTVLETFLKLTPAKLPALFGIVAFNLFYWHATPLIAGSMEKLTGRAEPDWAVWTVRGLFAAASLYWLWRTFDVERRFVRRTLESATGQSVRLGAGAAAALASESRRAGLEVTIEPDGRRVAAEPDSTLLEVVERCGLALESGCRMGICGADPVAIVAGTENLAPAGADETATLARLGYAPNTRMACRARVHGPVSVELKPQAAAATASVPVPAFDASIRRIVIVGNGIAGVTAADFARRTHPECEIHLVGRERFPLYNRMGITRLIHGRSAMQGLYLLPDAWYEKHGITSWLNTRVDAIDVGSRAVRLGTGETLGYDRLVLATGGRSFVPALQGFGGPGCYVLRDADHAMHVRDYVQRRRARHAIVAGGGLLGLEAADGLRQLGLDVVVLERGAWPLQRQVDERGGRMLLGYLSGLGIGVLADAEATRLEVGAAGPTAAILGDGRSLPCEVFVACAGMRPDIDLATAAGIRTDRGILVDDRLQTSVAGVYAAGDVAQHRDRVYGLWPASAAQGEIAGVNAAGGSREYAGTIPATLLKIVGAELASVGRIAPEPADEVIAFEAPSEYRYAKLVVRDGLIIGALMIGHGHEAALVADAVKAARPVHAQLERLRQGEFSALAQ